MTSPVHSYSFPAFVPPSAFSRPYEHEILKPLNTNLKPRIVFFGQTGSGKSCAISTCEMVVRDSYLGTAKSATPGQEGTIILEEYLQEKNFTLVDTRGFFTYNSDEIHEFFSILYGQQPFGEEIERIGTTKEAFTPPVITSDYLENMAHAVVFVIKANDPRLTNGSYVTSLTVIRAHLQKLGMVPICLITFDDLLTTPQQQQEALDSACRAVGCSEKDALFIRNYCSTNIRSATSKNAITEEQCIAVLERALISAERFIKIQNHRIINKLRFVEQTPDVKDWSKEQVMAWTQENMGSKTNLSSFAQHDINGSKLLTLSENEISSLFNFSAAKRFKELLKELKK